MRDQQDKIMVIMTREEIERLMTILNSIFRRDSDIEHFEKMLDRALHAPRPVKGIEKPS